MSLSCASGHCTTPCWVRKVLLAAGFYHLLFAVWAMGWPGQWFDWAGLVRPNHPMMWQGFGVLMGGLGCAFIIAARDPIHNWQIVLLGFAKFTLGIVGFSVALERGEVRSASLWMMVVDHLVWWFPFAAVLWTCVRAHIGVPPTRSTPLEISEASEIYQLSDGRSLADASKHKVLALVFLRHFGCTFTRQILRELEDIQREAITHGAELVLVHMLQSGKEARYLGQRGDDVARIADPRCELYRAFGLGKGGFFELFGPRVWWRGVMSLFQGCGVGHLAGDGLQMPGAFLFRDGKIISSQRASSAADLPDLPGLFRALPLPVSHGTVTACSNQGGDENVGSPRRGMGDPHHP